MGESCGNVSRQTGDLSDKHEEGIQVTVQMAGMPGEASRVDVGWMGGLG